MNTIAGQETNAGPVVWTIPGVAQLEPEAGCQGRWPGDGLLVLLEHAMSRKFHTASAPAVVGLGQAIR